MSAEIDLNSFLSCVALLAVLVGYVVGWPE